MADRSAGSHTDGSPNSSSSDGDQDYSTERQPMTAKGIKRLCYELLDIKKASEEDFYRNVYSCYSAFVRIFEEISWVNYDLKDLKQHISNQSKLIQGLFNSLYLEKLSDYSTEIKLKIVEDLDLCFDTEIGSQISETLDTLDVLLSEQQLYDALVLLQIMTKRLEMMKTEEHLTPMITSYLCEISDRRARLVKQLILLAEHPRVAQPELQRALNGLCRLGEQHQTNTLLVKFYELRLKNHLQELMSQKASMDHIYLYEVAKVVFSVISQAAKCFILLYGETYPYAPEFMDWATKEIGEFSNLFEAYFESMLEVDGRFQFIVEVVNCTFSLCSLLRYQRLLLLPYLVNCFRPFLEDVIHKHVNQYREVASILADNETWVLSKYLLSEMSEVIPCLPGHVGEEEYFLLTSSGRKCAMLLRAVVDDFSSLIAFELESSFAQGLADLINEYICGLERSVQFKENSMKICGQGMISTPRLEQQLLLLVNISTFVDLVPIITAGILSCTNPPCSLEQVNTSLQELRDLVLSIEEAADRIRNSFSQQLVYEAMSSGLKKSKPIWELNSEYNNWFPTSSKQDHVTPSYIFQELFQGLRKLENISKCDSKGKHSITEKLLEELMEAVIIWLSNNVSLWKNTEEYLDTEKCGLIMQIHEDIHFLLEIARLGGYLSDNLVAGAMDILTKTDVMNAESALDSNGVFSDNRRVKDIVQLVIGKLHIEELVEPSLKEEPLRMQISKGVCPSVRDAAGTSVDFDQQDNVCESSAEEYFMKSNSTELEDPDKPTINVGPNGGPDASAEICSVKIRESWDAVCWLKEDDKYSEIEGKANNDINFIYRLDTDVETHMQPDIAKMKNMARDAELLEVSNKVGASNKVQNAEEEILKHDWPTSEAEETTEEFRNLKE
ncbi:exocyst complex component [Canna indica]|uniref:Exocyst complex component n=1 Tax=Canna indica TaxID=4628 RepID=A0AAQ3JN06_9LILI|nr:exocyst complex component [Canna indica]